MNNKKELKLNYKRTINISLAFFSILMLWQVYNTYCPLFLKDLLGDNKEYLIGTIMALDNVVALFMLPLFGRLSDKTKTRFGKRMPYIIIGMFLASIVFPLIALAFVKRSAVLLIVTMCIILCIMHMYRTPAVSLMPDLTPKPLRSKANGIINLVGYLGPIIAGLIAMFIKYDEHPLIPFVIASICLVISALILIFTINENKLLEEVKEDLKIGEELSQTLESVSEDKPLSKKDKSNLVIILLATFLWYMAFNALESFLSLYCEEILGESRLSGNVTIILTISSVITFIPAGILANKIGRKKSILIGLVSLFIGFLGSAIVTTRLTGPSMHIIFFLFVIFAGIGWAVINVSSYPMVCECANQKNIGKISSYYYVSSMLAQSVTPILVGLIMSKNGYEPLFYYSSVLTVVAFIVFVFYKENKEKVEIIKKGLFENFDQD